MKVLYDKGKKTMKKYLAFILALLLGLSLCACGGGSAEIPTKPAPTEPEENIVEDDGIMRILILGHSLGVDSAYLLPAIMEAEGMTDFEIGLVYGSYSMNQHREWITTGAKKYCYREYTYGQDTNWRRADCYGNFTMSVPGEANDIYIEDGSIAQPMEYAIERRDWDIVIIMAGSSEQTGVEPAGHRDYFDAGNIQPWLDFVLEHDIEKATKPKFAWHMCWSFPNDDSLLNDARRAFKQKYFGTGPEADLEAYKSGMEVTKEQVLPFNFDYILPAGTAIQNAKSSALTGRALYRDYIHCNDYGRLIAGYTWFCTLTGTDIRDCKIGPFHYEAMLDQVARLLKQPVELTQQQKDILVESVENALKNPYEMTQSQYTK